MEFCTFQRLEYGQVFGVRSCEGTFCMIHEMNQSWKVDSITIFVPYLSKRKHFARKKKKEVSVLLYNEKLSNTYISICKKAPNV